jgi:rhamnosyltransferase
LEGDGVTEDSPDTEAEMGLPVASVIVRTFNSAPTVLTTMRSIRAQDMASEILVVDSGSNDDTLDLVAPFADTILHIKPEEFTFGGSLNIGAAAAAAPVHVALSSHCVLPRPDWLRIAVGQIRDGAVAAVGMPTDALGRPLERVFLVNRDYLLAHHYWGFSNHASAWSAEAWRAHPFDESLVASEDKEWSWRALGDNGVLAVDPRLVVPGVHRRAAGVRMYYRRLRKEIDSVHDLRPLPRYGMSDMVLDWGRAHPRDPFVLARRRLGRTRLVEVLARWRSARRR